MKETSQKKNRNEESLRHSATSPRLCGEKRFPSWLKRKIPRGGHADRVRKLLADLKLSTVCQNALCPNLGECFGAQTATFLIMGSVCTRNCRFCAITGGTPAPLDPDEPRRVAEAAQRLKLKHVVLTSVTRDDLPDGGASHFINTVGSIRAACNATVEILTPDFQGDENAILAVAACEPDIFNHNVETVPRLYESVRPLADYRRSLDLLRLVKDHSPAILTKSGLMVGLGETGKEVESLLRDLRAAGCDIVTIGQYLQPSPEHLPVERYVHPDEFEEYRQQAEEMGFSGIASGPYVRSSYNARRILEGRSAVKIESPGVPVRKCLPVVSIVLFAALLVTSLGMIRYVVNSFEVNFNRLAATVADTNPQQLERAREILSAKWSLYETWQCGALFGFLAIAILIFFVCYYPKMFQAKLVKAEKPIFAVPSAAALFVGALGAYIDWRISIVPILDEILIGDLSVAWRVLISSTHIGAACSLTIAALWLIYFLFAPEREEASEQ